jgi:hypothetical protein
MLVPSTAIVLVIPLFIRLMISARPSTMIISLLPASSGPAGSLSGPYLVRPLLLALETADVISSVPGVMSSSQPLRMLIALLTTLRRFAPRISSNLRRVTLAVHGPTRSTVSRDAANIAVAVLLSDTGITISPLLLPLDDLMAI